MVIRVWASGKQKIRLHLKMGLTIGHAIWAKKLLLFGLLESMLYKLDLQEPQKNINYQYLT